MKSISKSVSDTQCELILKFMRKNGCMTTLDATNRLNIMSFHRRLSDLKEQGYVFGKERKHLKSISNGKVRCISYMQYTILNDTPLAQKVVKEADLFSSLEQ